MKSHHLISTAVVIVAAVIAADVFTGADAEKLSAIADERSAAKGPKQATSPAGRFSPYVDRDGTIYLPQGYKQEWSHLGNWAVAKKAGQTIYEMHDVYTQPETIVAFNKTGEFPDGAVLVKEVRESKADQLTTGHSAWSTDMKIWFVMIKDRHERFEDSDHWGDGWGWALFEAKDPFKNVSAGYDTSCLGCHVPAKDSDWIYTYGYPELKKPE